MPPIDDRSRSLLGASNLATAAQILAFAAAVLGLFAQILYLTAIVGGLALVLYVASLVVSRRGRQKLRNRVDLVFNAVDLEHVLRETAFSLGLAVSGQGWRLSLYRLELEVEQPDRGSWALQARAANQRVFELTTDLMTMSLEQGVLRTAVISADQPLGGIDEMPSLPDPEANLADWIAGMSAWGFDWDDVSAGMRSRIYCGRVFRVGLNRGKGKDMTLGLVAESQNPIGVNRQAMEEVLTRPVFELLYELLRLREEMRTSLRDLDDVLP